jgi:hypothetical protein
MGMSDHEGLIDPGMVSLPFEFTRLVRDLEGTNPE